MSDENTNKIALVNLPDMPESVDNALTNLTDSPTKNAGQTFGDLWYLVFGGISHAADKRRMKYTADLEKYHQELTESIDCIAEDKKIEPSIQITAQALENSKYCVSSKSLRNMFVKLISGTMNSDFEPLVHPSFPEMIKQMDDIDAHLLMELKRYGDFPIANFKEVSNTDSSYVYKFKNAYISKTFHLPIQKCSRSLSSLERMGLVKLSFMSHLEDSMYYDFEKLDIFQNIRSEIIRYSPGVDLALEKGVCSITPLGKDFINLCVS